MFFLPVFSLFFSFGISLTFFSLIGSHQFVLSFYSFVIFRYSFLLNCQSICLSIWFFLFVCSIIKHTCSFYIHFLLVTSWHFVISLFPFLSVSILYPHQYFPFRFYLICSLSILWQFKFSFIKDLFKWDNLYEKHLKKGFKFW